MVWQKMTFIAGLKELLRAFETNPEVQRLALVWRTPDEWNVLDEWLLGQIKNNFDGATLRVVVWVTRKEAAELVAVFREEK